MPVVTRYLSLLLLGTMLTSPAWAEEPAAPAGPAAAAPATPAPPVLGPALAGPLVANPKPFNFDFGPTILGPLLGKAYITGALSGLGVVQTHAIPGDSTAQADISNGQIFVQKVDGFFQYYVQVGIYALPSLGTPYIKASTITGATYGALPQAYAKFQLTDALSVQAGKLPTLIGAEYTFSVQNFNIARGLLWNQENAVNRGVQANYTIGPVALSFSWNDGFYSNKLSWLSGLLTWTIDPANAIAFAGGGNIKPTTVGNFATPALLNNEEIYNIIYTYNKGNWTVQPYVQYSHVPALPTLGTTRGASTYAGALLAKYQLTPTVSLPARFEYISSTGTAASGAPSLLYGPGSSAWSITATPTYQSSLFFIRGEGSITVASGITPGLAFGENGDRKSQWRFLLETGFLF